MMRPNQQRLLVAFVATAIGAAVGALAGYWIGHSIVMGQALGRLDQQATRIMVEGEALKTESRQVLKELNGSAYSFCSDEEIGYFRKLVFRSHYLKEAGHIRGGRIDCSTTLGRGAQSQTKFKPDFTQLDGTLVYRDLDPFRIDQQTVITFSWAILISSTAPISETFRLCPSCTTR